VVEEEQEYMVKAQAESHLQMDGEEADQAVKVVVQPTMELQADLLLQTHLVHRMEENTAVEEVGKLIMSRWGQTLVMAPKEP
jgi:hypothetical protein